MPTDNGNVFGLAHRMTQCAIAVHGIRKARDIITEMQQRINDAIHDQQRRHPEDWKDVLPPAAPSITAPPVVPAQPVQAEAVAPKNTTKIPQIPSVAG